MWDGEIFPRAAPSGFLPVPPPSALTRGGRAHSSQARVGHALSQISTGAGPFDHVDGKWRAMLPS